MHYKSNMPMRSLLVAFVLAISSTVLAQTSAPAEQPLKPNLQFPTQESYEKEIAEPALLLQNDHLWLFAPKRKSTEATAIFKRLAAAYDELYRIVGEHTKYKI